MTHAFNLQMDKELEILIDKYEETNPVIPQSIAQVIVVWNYWESFMKGIRESSNSFFDEGFSFNEILEDFELQVFREEIVDKKILQYVWDYQKEKCKDQKSEFLN